jgi:hypothetical protein
VTFYQSIEPVSEPFDNGLDDQGRPTLTFNVMTVKRPSATFIKELVSVLVAAGVGTWGGTIFAGESVTLPADADNDPPFLSLYATGGPGPMKTHNDISPPAWPRPSAKITVHAPDYVALVALAYAAYNALGAVRNIDIVPVP